VRIGIEHVGQTFLVHNGKDMIRVQVTSGMVDHKFGEFVRTRKSPPRAPPKKQGRK
jgi:Ribosomal protein S19